MKVAINQVLTRIVGSLLLLGAVLSGASAQTAPSQPAAGAGGVQTLTGNIRWRKSFGMIPSPRGSRQAHNNPCSIFWVAALDPENDFKLVWFANALEPGRDDPEYYTCNYSIILPANRRLVIKAGMGGNETLTALPKVMWPDYYYRDLWIGEPMENRKLLLRTGGPYYLVRSFKPAAQEVTLHNVKATFLKFEMIYREFPLGRPPATEEATGGKSGPAAPKLEPPFINAGQVVFPVPGDPTGSVVLSWDGGPGDRKSVV